MFAYIYQFIDSFSFLVLSAIGLAIVFGMMNIINMAHGEFIMLGAYAFTVAYNNGIPFVPSVAIAAVFVAVFGIIIDRVVICRLYSRPLDSIVVTYGLSLALSQLIQIIFGPTMPAVGIPLGSVTISGGNYSLYRIVLFVCSLILLFVFYMLFNHTKFGIYSRATMQNPEVASSLGINTNLEYSVTFAIGAGIAGLTGALYAPLMSVIPTMGESFIIQAFTTVVVGGANPLVGTTLSGIVLGLVNGSASLAGGAFMGRIAMLIAAIICIRILPGGFSGLIDKIKRGA